MNFLELNYTSNGCIDSVKIAEYSRSLLDLYNRYFSELGKDEQQMDRMNSILLYNYNFDNEFERLVFSELLNDAVTKINYNVINYFILTQEKLNKFSSTLGSLDGNTDIFLHFIEHKIKMDKELRPETKDLIRNYTSFLLKNPRLNLILTIDETVIDHNFEEVEIFLNRMVKEVKSKNGGCYIATMAYGDYDHPQVIILRQFRDEVLDKSIFGNWFIKIYYHYSPRLVEKLKYQRTVNSIIRKTLNQFIKLIKK